MNMKLSVDYAPAMGDVRTLGTGDTLWLIRGAEKRPDWPRYTDAIAQAVGRGADARWATPALSPEEAARQKWQGRA